MDNHIMGLMGLSGAQQNLKATNRTQEQKKNLMMRQKAAFIPRRCEVVGCTVTGSDSLSSCAQCKCVFYCGAEHQGADWGRHKKECKHLAKAGLQPIHYRTDEELAKYPIGCFPLASVDLATAHCFMCGAGANEVNLGYTRCCNAVVCDNEHEYEMMSYSRDHCIRSHSRYTTCGSHFSEGHSGDWRTCHDCRNRLSEDTGARTWYSTNGFNITPDSESSFPKGSNLTARCAHKDNGQQCKKRILPGHDQEMMSSNGTGSECMAHMGVGANFFGAGGGANYIHQM